jgi:hypothetical protein
MFKGILPSSKRISTSEFDIVSPAVDPTVISAIGSGKENYNAFPLSPSSKPQVVNKSMHNHKMSHSKPKEHQPVETNQAFDKLLVSTTTAQLLFCFIFSYRMIYKFHSLFVQNLLEWNRQ